MGHTLSALPSRFQPADLVRTVGIFLLSATATPQTGTETRLGAVHSSPTRVSSFLHPGGTSRFRPCNGSQCVKQTHKGSFPAIFVSTGSPRPHIQLICSSKAAGIPKQKNKATFCSLIVAPAPGLTFRNGSKRWRLVDSLLNQRRCQSIHFTVC